MFVDPFPTGMDCVLFAHQLVIWTPEQNTALFAGKAHAALDPGGRVVIFNSMSNDEGDGPLVAALDSVYFAALPAEGGMIYPLAAGGLSAGCRIRSRRALPRTRLDSPRDHRGHQRGPMSPPEPAGASAAPGTLAAFLQLARVKFLFQSMMVTGFGVTLGRSTRAGGFSLSWYLLTLGFAWSTHLMAHAANEYFDLEADRANSAPTSWTGGGRPWSTGCSAPVSLASAFVTLFAGIALTAAMPTRATRLLAVALMALAWFYTAPPLRLNYRPPSGE